MCSKSIVILLVPLFVDVHLFVDMLLSTPMTMILMWLVFVAMTVDLMLLESVDVTTKVMCFEFSPSIVALILNQSDPPIVLHFCVP
jgi:hypothetical protein